MTNTRRGRLLCLLLALCLMLLPGCARGESEAETLSVTFFDAGKADAILVRTGEHALLIDTGLNKNGAALVDALRAAGVQSLDVLLITHFDKDHVGGADSVLSSMPVGAIYQPDYPKDSKQMRQYLKAAQDAGVNPIALSENCELTLGGARLLIDVANEDDYGADEENDFSLVVSLRFGETRFLFAGDAEETRIDELLIEGDLAHDVLKVPHHGKRHDNNAAFFRAVSPRYAVITSSDDDPEKEETVHLLEEAGAVVLLTRQGAVTITSDGENLTVTQAG